MTGALILAALVAAMPRVYVDGGEYAEQLAAALAKEPDLVVGTATSAQVLVSLTSTTGALMLVVKEENGATALERKIDLARGIDPALRMAVLLIRGAFEPAPVDETPMPAVAVIEENTAKLLASRPPEVIAPEDIAPAKKSFGFEITPAIATADIANIDPAPAISLHARIDRLALGATVLYALGVGGKQNTGEIEGEIHDFLLMADVAYTLADGGGLAIGAFASGGIDFIRATTSASMPPYASRGTPNEIREHVFVFAGGLDAKVAVAGPVSIALRAGVRVTPQRIEVGLPADFVADNPLAQTPTPLKSSVVAGFLSIGATLEVF